MHMNQCKFAQIYPYESLQICTDLYIKINAYLHRFTHMNQCRYAQIYAYESMQICTDLCLSINAIFSNDIPPIWLISAYF